MSPAGKAGARPRRAGRRPSWPAWCAVGAATAAAAAGCLDAGLAASRESEGRAQAYAATSVVESVRRSFSGDAEGYAGVAEGAGAPGALPRRTAELFPYVARMPPPSGFRVLPGRDGRRFVVRVHGLGARGCAILLDEVSARGDASGEARRPARGYESVTVTGDRYGGRCGPSGNEVELVAW